MKKRIALFLAFFMLMSIAGTIGASAWTDGPKIVKSDATTFDTSEGYPENAFDGDETTLWHSNWHDEGEGTAQNIYPQSLIVELDNTYYIDCIGYLTRQNAFNGTAFEYEVWVSTTGAVTDFDKDTGWTKVANGTWDELTFWEDWKTAAADADGYGAFVNVNFDPVEAKLVKFKIFDGVGGWACAAELELGFLGVNYKPNPAFTPKSAPGTPAPVAAVVEEPVAVVETPVVAAVVETPVAPVAAATAPKTGDAGIAIALAALFAVAVVTTKTVRKYK